MRHFNWQNSIGGQDFVINDSYCTLQRYDVAKTIFACLYRVLRCLDEKQEAAVSGSVFVQISLHPVRTAVAPARHSLFLETRPLIYPCLWLFFWWVPPLLFLMMIIIPF